MCFDFSRRVHRYSLDGYRRSVAPLTAKTFIVNKEAAMKTENTALVPTQQKKESGEVMNSMYQVLEVCMFAYPLFQKCQQLLYHEFNIINMVMSTRMVI